ncbi:MAG: AmmeMemoRadiSam system radical SAM enzyme [Desulfosalsimonadaceae bacterium]
MKTLSRREFISGAAMCLAAFALPVPPAVPAFGDENRTPSGPSDITGNVFSNDAPKNLWKWAREGYFYDSFPEKTVMCGICPHSCGLEPGDRGVCRSRVNVDGKLYTLTYGSACSVNVDPVEKKPLFHFKPGTRSFSIAAAGCNFRCLNCQNWQISQARPEDIRNADLPPQEVVSQALTAKAASIAYTYSEATTFYEYMIDTARLGREKNLSSLWISNGYMNEKPLSKLSETIDAANINLKSFDNTIYQKLNGGTLGPVLTTLKTLHDRKVHLEITTLVVPGFTDDPQMIKHMCRWIVHNLGPDHPLHFLRFFPLYKLDRLPPTPVSALTNFRKIAMDAGIRYVYVGNVPEHEGNHTWCHYCGKLLVERKGYAIPVNNLEGSKCRFCKTEIPGVWA